MGRLIPRQLEADRLAVEASQTGRNHFSSIELTRLLQVPNYGINAPYQFRGLDSGRPRWRPRRNLNGCIISDSGRLTQLCFSASYGQGVSLGQESFLRRLQKRSLRSSSASLFHLFPDDLKFRSYPGMSLTLAARPS